MIFYACVKGRSWPLTYRLLLIMKLVVFMTMLSIVQATAGSYAQTITLRAENMTLSQAMRSIQKQSGYPFFLNGKDLAQTKINVFIDGATLEDAMQDLLTPLSLEWVLKDKTIIIKRAKLKPKDIAGSFLLQQRAISGRVQDEKGEALAGVTVSLKGTQIATTTDNAGRYQIATPTSSGTLVFAIMGYGAVEQPIDNKSIIDVSMTPSISDLDEVVVVGYGTQKKVNLTGSVATIKGEDLVVTKNENAINMLAGKVPGVRITQGSSEPGAFMSAFDIRGYGAAPLVVIDGVPRGGMERLNPEDIESISVLKDASASVYGVRAANGVVLITTKKGKMGKPDVSYSYNMGLQQMLNVASQTTALQYYIMRNEQNRRQFRYYTGFTGTDIYPEQAMEPFEDGTRQTTDWRDEVLRDIAPQSSHNLSVSGGTERVNYYVGAGYMDQNSFFKSGDINYNRFNLRANVDAKISDYLSVDIGIYGIKDKRQSGQVNSQGLLKSLYTNMPDDPVYAFNDARYPWRTADEVNPVVMMDRELGGYIDRENYNYQANAAAHFKIPGVEGLAVHGKFAYDFSFADEHNYAKAHNLYRVSGENLEEYLVRAPSKIRRFTSTNNATNMQLSVDYNRIFHEKHNVQLLALFEESHFLSDNYGAERRLYVDRPYLFAGVTDGQNTLMNTGDFEGTSQGFVGKAHYDYLSKYIVDLSARYDGSSKFKPGPSQWGLFPSASLAWRISQEPFAKNTLESWRINDIKLRMSYGKLGDDRSSSYQFITGYNYPAAGYVVNGMYVNGTETRGLANENITWYTSTIADWGFDGKLFDSKFGVTFDYYIRNRDGLLGTRSLTIPGTFGATLPEENINSDRTSGFELELSYQDRVNDFDYSVTAFFSQTRTKIIHNERALAGNSYDNWRNNLEGRYNDIWWGKGYSGRYTSYEEIYSDEVNRGGGNQAFLPGDYVYEDWNGDGQINDWDIKPIGIKNTPLLNYAMMLTGSYHGFDLYMHFQGTFKAYKQYEGQVRDPLTWGRNSLDYFWDRWHPVDPKADYFDPHTEWVPGIWHVSGSSSITDAANIQNASYLRLKTVELGYTFPKQIINILGKSCRIYVNAYNLVTFTKFRFLDPEAFPNIDNTHQAQAPYPNNRTFNFGGKITF